MYDSQIVHHDPCFNLFLLHNNSFDNPGSEINKNDVFLLFLDILSNVTLPIALFLPKSLITR